MGVKAHMICHTHWDREWYFTKEEFRIKLIRLIDGLLDIVEEVPDYVSFMLDGQTIAIEDYLEIKPYQKDRLFKALASGKIICGPWYILPDELLVSGESHIRNYLKGQEVLKDTGEQMKIAYLPDSFGHPSQMPQIIEGLGLEAMIFWRGTSNEVENTEFYWESPYSDSKILCIHMPCGYGNSANLSENQEETLPRIQSLLKELEAKSTTDVVLLMNGSDHIIGQKNITQIVQALNQELKLDEVVLSTMEAYLKELKEKLPELKVYTGEFRSGERSMMLGGTLSTRGYLKQQNTKVQDLMERYLEPVLSLERFEGGTWDSKGYMNYIWKKILENHPHDSICGCSIDEVHQEMMTRLGNLTQLEEQLLKDAMLRLEELFATEEETKATQLFLFEPVTGEEPSYLEVEISLDTMLVQEVNFAKSIIEDYEPNLTHPQIPGGLCIMDELGRKIPFVLLDAKKGYNTLYQDHTAPEIYKGNQMKVLLLLPPMEYGLHVLTVKPCEEKAPQWETVQEMFIENEYYQVNVENGQFCITDKKRNKIHPHGISFVDKGDAGDEYTYSWPKEDKTISLDISKAEVIKEKAENISQCMKISGELELPKGLTADRTSRSEEYVACPFTLEISLFAGIERIDVSMEFENLAMDHRLQVRFKAGIQTDYSESFHTFGITKRSVDVEVPKEWVEYPQSTHPTHGFMNLEEKGYGLGVSVKGLNEFEAVKEEGETALYVTLLRCVGWLSRTDLLTRHGNGGWTIETPEGQCLGSHRFECSLSYHDGCFLDSNLYKRMEKFRYPSYGRQVSGTHKIEITENHRVSFLKDMPKELILSAFKPSEDGKELILRVFSIGTEDLEWKITFTDEIKGVALAKLTEEPEAVLEQTDGFIQILVKPGQIITLRINTTRCTGKPAHLSQIKEEKDHDFKRTYAVRIE